MVIPTSTPAPVDLLPPAVVESAVGLLGGVIPGPSPSGLGVGSVLVPVALLVSFASLYILDVSDEATREIRRSLLAAVVPLFVTFVGIVVYSL